MTRRLVVAGASASTPFAYTCGGCGRCCRNKAITVNPYELLRIARTLGVSTGRVLRDHVDAETQTLRRTASGECVFLRGNACGVHEGRPAACRIYPLAMVEPTRGERRFHLMRLDPDSEGTFSESGTIASFLVRQGLDPFDAPYDAYRLVFSRLDELGDEGRARVDPSVEWIDVDAALGQRLDPEAAWRAHIAVIEAALDRAE